jgi:hypothetical protein
LGLTLNRIFSRLPLERILMCVCIVLGLLHMWVSRYAMNPDGMSYLDVGDSFFRQDWANAVNAWWSPLYPWTLGLVLGIAKPLPRWEFPIVHLVNFGFFLGALLAFRFLLHALLAIVRKQTISHPSNGEALPEWALTILAYSVFLWIALEVQTLFIVSPDLAVLACVCLTAGMLLRLRLGHTLGKFALLGLILGIGYWAKTILFPLGFVALASGFLWKRSSPGWRRGMIMASLVFLCTSLPLILLLSEQKGRFTFGDSGKMGYAMLVSPRTFPRNWQGEIPGGGTPAHPTRQLLQHPPLFEFDGPVVGTYPPWCDPSYWNEGLQWQFKLKPQLEALAGSFSNEAGLLLRARPELVVGVIVLVLLSGPLWLAGLRELCPLITISVAGLLFYLPILAIDRYLGGFVLVLFLALLATVRLRPDARLAAAYVAVAVSLTMALGTADYTGRTITNHLAMTRTRTPLWTWQDVLAAEQLRRIGAQPGDRVAIVADGTNAYWASLAKLRIVAEIMDANGGSREFWSAPEQVQNHVYDLFARSGARLVVASCPPIPPGVTTGWEQIPGTLYCVRSLPNPK